MKFDYLPLLTGTYGTKPVFYNIRYRIVRVRITKELAETLITNLPADQYPPEKLKELYAMRWGIETSFRSLKYTVGMLHFNSKKAECISSFRKCMQLLSSTTSQNGSLLR
jgi:IS4 transposase